MNPRLRWTIIGGLLLATLAAVALVDADPPPAADAGESMEKKAGKPAKPAKSAPSASSAAPVESALPAAAPALADAVTDEAPAIDPFRTMSWVVAPPPPPPAKPVAPPLPFQYLGKLNEGGEVRVFLSAQGKHLIARVGDVIDGVYLVETISGGTLTFVYQPLQQRQQLAIGGEK